MNPGTTATTSTSPHARAPALTGRSARLSAPHGRLRPAWIKLGLVASSVLLLTLSFAPYGQFYLAWIGLAPLLLAVAKTSSTARAFAWGWLAGAAFFAVNVSWLFRATTIGALAAVIYLGMYWALASAVVRGCGFLRDGDGKGGFLILGALATGAVWVATEWLRCTVFNGFPFLLIGTSQTPFVAMCQVADFAGVYGVSFVVAALNALLVVGYLNRSRRAALARLAVAAAALLVFCLVYGAYRLAQDALYPGPRVLVVQPNHLHARGGAKVVTQQDQIEFHFPVTEAALAVEPADLVVWSETVMPPLNDEVRHELRNESAGRFLAGIDRRLAEFARRHGTALVTGAYYAGGWRPVDGKRTATDIRNAVYVYHPDGRQSAARYDKIYLVAFGEYLPFEHTVPPLYRLFRHLAAYSVDYSINPAPPDALTVFEVATSDEPVRFVTPVCFEDMSGWLIARMFRPRESGRSRKAADLIVNVTNDGWFLGNMQAQHLQAAVFRSIENRAPTARAANTGISGFVDSNGRVDRGSVLPVRTDGTLTRRVMLDRRVAPYTRVGDLFAWTCVAVSAFALIATAARRIRRRSTAAA